MFTRQQTQQQHTKELFPKRAALHPRCRFSFWMLLLFVRLNHRTAATTTAAAGNYRRRIASCMAFGIPRWQQQQQQKTSRLKTRLYSGTLERNDLSASIIMNGTNKVNDKPIKARIVSTDMLADCGARLRQGDLVAFPTETVYGLGCNALDEAAISKVFQAKERPLTDPLISHVSDPKDAFRLWDAKADSIEGKALRVLCEKFWPGPLTLVARAAPHVPALLMANTGFVACRSPQHPISVALIDAAQVPLAAPSANKFGHVSPTRSKHVWDDLLYEDVWIIDTPQNNEDVCDVGVESSVAKIEMSNSESNPVGRITLLRQGAVSLGDIDQCLRAAGLSDAFVVEASTKKTSDDKVATVAPGQSIRHYSPDIPSYILSHVRYENNSKIEADDINFLSTCVIIDFGGKLKSWSDHVVAYKDLSEDGNPAQATKSVFETLRWAEQVQNAARIIFPEITEDDPLHADALVLALKDRLTRAASGVVIDALR